MDPGWFVLSIFLMAEMCLVTLLCMPVPNNDVRGWLTKAVVGLLDHQSVRLIAGGCLLLDLIYFYFVFDALLHPLDDFGVFEYFGSLGLTCEAKQELFYRERNAYLTGMSLFLAVVLMRLVDIQHKLHLARLQIKQDGAAGGSVVVADKKRV